MKQHLNRLTTFVHDADKLVMFKSGNCDIWFFTNKSDKVIENFRNKYDDRRKV